MAKSPEEIKAAAQRKLAELHKRQGILLEIALTGVCTHMWTQSLIHSDDYCEICSVRK